MRYSLPTAVLLSASLMMIAGCERPKGPGLEQGVQGPLPVGVQEVKSGDIPMVLEANGQTQGSNAAQIYARVSGYLQKIHYTEGSKVHEGQTLFTIDPSDLNNAKDSAKAALSQATASHDNAVLVLERVKPLAAAHASSQQELDNAIATERTTAAAMASAKASYEQAKLNLGYATIKAPIGGYADKRKIDLGTYVTPGSAALLTTIYQTDPLYINFSLSEAQKLAYQNAIASGKLSTPAKDRYTIGVTLADGSSVTKEGTINFVSPFFDTTTGTISYRATLKNSDSKLLPGQFVRVSVQGMTWKDVVHVPQKAVLTGEKGKFVYVAETNNTVSPRPVVLGEWSGDEVVVFQGLQKGEKIVVDGLTKLRPSAPIKPTLIP